jgi:hypothetical protein
MNMAIYYLGYSIVFLITTFLCEILGIANWGIGLTIIVALIPITAGLEGLFCVSKEDRAILKASLQSKTYSKWLVCSYGAGTALSGILLMLLAWAAAYLLPNSWPDTILVIMVVAPFIFVWLMPVIGISILISRVKLKLKNT